MSSDFSEEYALAKEIHDKAVSSHRKLLKAYDDRVQEVSSMLRHLEESQKILTETWELLQMYHKPMCNKHIKDNVVSIKK